MHTLLQSLSKQHEMDLEIYRRAHAEWRNRILHWILIPVETFSFLLFLAVALSIGNRQQQKYGGSNAFIMSAIGWTIGLVSLAIAGQDHLFFGVASLIFHIVAVAICDKLVHEKGPLKALIIGTVCWTLAWTLQVGVGHWIWERNQPNVANMNMQDNDVSWLSMTQSVLIAWSSYIRPVEYAFLDPVTFLNDASHMDLVKGFKPTRWMDETARPGQEFIPFGVGPRYCLGADLALVEVKIFLAMLARSILKFDLVYPKVTASNEIAWREKALIPVPDKGVIIQPIWK